MSLTEEIKIILRDVLQLGDQVIKFDESTQLIGAIPEFDSMAVVSLVASIEEHFDITFEDDDISAENFESVGQLIKLVDEKLSE